MGEKFVLSCICNKRIHFYNFSIFSHLHLHIQSNDVEFIQFFKIFVFQCQGKRECPTLNTQCPMMKWGLSLKWNCYLVPKLNLANEGVGCSFSYHNSLIGIHYSSTSSLSSLRSINLLLSREKENRQFQMTNFKFYHESVEKGTTREELNIQ